MTRQCAWPSGIHAYRAGVCTRCGAVDTPSPVAARTVDHDDAVATLHTAIQVAAELAPVRTDDGYMRPYLSTDAPYARKGL